MTISSQIIEVLNHLCLKFGLAIDWSQENILPYLQELAGKYISWEMATSTAWLLGAAIMLIVAVVLFVCDKKWGMYGIGIAIGVCLVCVLIGICISQIEDILACIYFPEKQIVEYVKHLMQTSR